MVAERIDDTADAPSIFLVGDRPNLGSAGFKGAGEDSIGIVNHHNHASGRALERLRALKFLFSGDSSATQKPASPTASCATTSPFSPSRRKSSRAPKACL